MNSQQATPSQPIKKSTLERLPSLRGLQLERLPSLRSIQQQRRTSFSHVCICLRAADLLALLEKLSCHCRVDLQIYCDHLQNSLRQGKDLRSLDLDEVSCFLEDFLSTNSDISCELAVDVHSCIGLISEKLGSVERSIQSLLRALWMQEKLSTSDDVSIAITQHRLGLAYAKTGNYQAAVHLLEKALLLYEAAKMKPMHTCILNAEESLNDFRVKQLEKVLKRGTPGSGTLTATIFEEETIPVI